MAYVFFKRRPLVSAEPDPIAVTITGSGNSTGCSATIDGTTYTAATSGLEVVAGDIIVFSVTGVASSKRGTVTIDGTTVKTVSSGTVTYEWTVPENITEIAIAYTYKQGYGTITVTTS